MKKNKRFSIYTIVIALLMTLGANIPAASQGNIKNDPDLVAKYDPALAAKYGADDYGMKSYTFVILRTGPNKTEDKALLAELFRSHMENINKLAGEGKLIIAGPMGKNDKQYRGIFVLNTTDHQEAREMLKGDRAIAEGVFEADLFTWYGSAALPAYLEVHEKIAKSNP
jgi:uncharacterized protein YciI